MALIWRIRFFIFCLLFIASELRAEELPKIPTVDQAIGKAAKKAPLALQFTGDTSEEFHSWQKKFRTKLGELLGPHTPPVIFSRERISQTDTDKFIREQWLLKAKGIPTLPLYLLRPKSKGPHPIILALHGHGKFGHDAVVGIANTEERRSNITKHNYDYGKEFANRGFLVIAPCMLPFGSRLDSRYSNTKTDPCAITFVRLSLLGQTLMGSNLRDCKWALDFACTQKDADSKRIACIGLSYGGRMTMLTAAMDQRIKIAVPSGALNLMQERIGNPYSCGAQVIPGLLKYGDVPEIGSLIAPRHCIWETGSQDKLIVPDWKEKAIERLEKAYQAAGYPNRLQIHNFEGGHRWDGITAIALLEKMLLGN